MMGSGGGAGSRVSGRDLELLEFVARFGVVPRSAAAKWARTARTVTLGREKRLREAGLLEVSRPWLSPEPVLVATREGLGACGRPDPAGWVGPAPGGSVFDRRRWSSFQAAPTIAIRTQAY
jgi:hypothetical protein